MTSFEGTKYKLAGYNIVQKGTLVDVFAKFCGVDQDPLDLPETEMRKMFANGEPTEMPCIYPTISPEQILEALIGKRDTAPDGLSHLRLPGGPEDLIADLGPEKLALLLVEMGHTKQEYLQSERRTFFPAI